MAAGDKSVSADADEVEEKDIVSMDALEPVGLNQQDANNQMKQGTIISGEIDEDEEDWTTVAMYEEEDYFSEDDEDDQEEEEDEYID